MSGLQLLACDHNRASDGICAEDGNPRRTRANMVSAAAASGAEAVPGAAAAGQLTFWSALEPP